MHFSDVCAFILSESRKLFRLVHSYIDLLYFALYIPVFMYLLPLLILMCFCRLSSVVLYSLITKPPLSVMPSAAESI